MYMFAVFVKIYFALSLIAVLFVKGANAALCGKLRFCRSKLCSLFLKPCGYKAAQMQTSEFRQNGYSAYGVSALPC